MFNSLRSWLTCPFEIRPYKGRNAAADIIYGEPVIVKGYYVGEVEIITNATGDDVVSSARLYYDPSDYTINNLDKLIIDGEEKDIIRITNYMDGNTGTSSCKVVYL